MSELPTSSVSAIAGCVIQPLDAAACDRYLAWLLGEPGANARDDAAGLLWALAHCDDGVSWGRYDRDAKTWRLGNKSAPEVSPPIRRETLQELRIFGEPGEILIWRTESGLRGRTLRETDPTSRPDESNPLRPSDEQRILRGDHVRAAGAHDFAHIADRAGAEQVVPVTVSGDDFGTPQVHRSPIRLSVRHYYEQDPATGAVRIAATRLVKLYLEGTHGA